MAGDCAPAEAIRYVPVAIGNRRPYKTRHGKGGVVISMAWRSLLRDKKQFAVIFLSFLIAGTVFLTGNTVILQNDARSVLNATWDYDIRFKNETTLDGMEPLLTEEKIKQVRAVPGVKSVRIVSSAEMCIRDRNITARTSTTLCLNGQRMPILTVPAAMTEMWSRRRSWSGVIFMTVSRLQSKPDTRKAPPGL